MTSESINIVIPDTNFVECNRGHLYNKDVGCPGCKHPTYKCAGCNRPMDHSPLNTDWRFHSIDGHQKSFHPSCYNKFIGQCQAPGTTADCFGSDAHIKKLSIN